MNITPIKTSYTPSFRMKFSPEIETQFNEDLEKLPTKQKKQEFYRLKASADYIISKFFRQRPDVTYGSIVTNANGEKRFSHTVNIGENKHLVFSDKNKNLYNFLSFINWHPGEEMEGTIYSIHKEYQQK